MQDKPEKAEQPKKPSDRPDAKSSGQGDVDPRIYVVVKGKQFPRPALETMFAEAKPGVVNKGCSCDPVVGVYCQCNKVAVPAAAPSCGCDSHSSGGVSYGCRCAPVH